jgi:regulatory protein
MSTSAFEQYLSRALHLCSRQEKSSSDILKKLSEWGAGEDDAARILQKLTEQKFVDDLRYAKAYTRQQHAFRKWGRIKIALTLKQKGIPEAFIDEALQELDEEEYRRTLKEELQKKRKSLKGRNRYDLLARLQKFAYGRGYEPDLVRKTVEEVLKGK